MRNPAFDVTPHRYVTAIVCERGVARAPYTESLRALAEALSVRILAIETSCDETAAAVVEDGRAHPLQRRLHPGRPARALRRRGAGAGLAPSPREHLPGDREGDGRRRRSTFAELDAVAVTQGPGLVGSLLVGRAGGQGHRVRARQAAGARASHRRPPRGAVPGPGRDVPAARARPRRLRRAHEPLRGAGARASTTSSAARATTPRARPSTRWRSCSGSAIPAAP